MNPFNPTPRQTAILTDIQEPDIPSEVKSPALTEIIVSLKEAKALVTLLQHEYISYDENGRIVNELLRRLQHFVYIENRDGDKR